MEQTTMFPYDESEYRTLRCRCGCGGVFMQKRVGRVRFYLNDEHKRRALARLARAKAFLVSDRVLELLLMREKQGLPLSSGVTSTEIVTFIEWLYEMSDEHRDLIVAALGELQMQPF